MCTGKPLRLSPAQPNISSVTVTPWKTEDKLSIAWNVWMLEIALHCLKCQRNDTKKKTDIDSFVACLGAGRHDRATFHVRQRWQKKAVLAFISRGLVSLGRQKPLWPAMKVSEKNWISSNENNSNCAMNAEYVCTNTGSFTVLDFSKWRPARKRWLKFFHFQTNSWKRPLPLPEI